MSKVIPMFRRNAVRSQYYVEQQTPQGCTGKTVYLIAQKATRTGPRDESDVVVLRGTWSQVFRKIETLRRRELREIVR